MTDKSHQDFSQNETIIECTAKISAAFLGNNTLSVSEIPTLISTIHQSLSSLETKVTPSTDDLVPAVAIKKSIFPDYIVCLEDGKKLKMLKRHLKTAYNMTPEQYKERWGLSADYPLVAPNYARQRSKLAKQIGLGTDRKKK